MQTATWQSALETKGAKVRSMIESQLQVYNSILDVHGGNARGGGVYIRTTTWPALPTRNA